MTINFLKPPPLPASLPPDLEKEINELRALDNNEKVLKQSYDLLTHKYRGYRFRTLSRIAELFQTDVGVLWEKEGFLHCNNMNYLMQILLVGSGKFKKEGIKFKWTTLHLLSPHEYLRVRINDKQWVDVDIWANVYGIKLGDHAHGFHLGHLRPVDIAK